MIPPKNIYLPKRSAWFCLLVVLVVALVALAGCGGGASASSSPSPTPVASTPTAGTGGSTPTTTPTTTPAPGFTQVVMVITDSNGAYGFTPAILTIRAGTTVIWRNVSSAPHTISSDDGQSFDSGTVAVGGTYRFTFKTAGAFPYHCNYHPYMRATINVI